MLMNHQLTNLRVQGDYIIGDNPNRFFRINDIVMITHPRYTERIGIGKPIDLYQAYQQYRTITLAEAVRRWKKKRHVIVQGDECKPTFLRRKKLKKSYPGLFCRVVELVNLDKKMVKLMPNIIVKQWLLEAIVNNSTANCLIGSAFSEGTDAPNGIPQ